MLRLLPFLHFFSLPSPCQWIRLLQLVGSSPGSPRRLNTC